MRLAGFAILLVCSAWAQTDARLENLHQTLQALQAQARDASAVNSDIGQKLTLAKHQLRDWIETQLDPVMNPGDETKVSESINKRLENVGVAPYGGNEGPLGSLGKVSLDFDLQSDLLIVITRIPIPCQQDDSAYAYKHVYGNWHRVWESEKNDYQNYTPQGIDAVYVAQSSENAKQTGPAYILTLGR